MRKRDLSIIIYCIVIILSIMYACQPIQPLLASKFKISISKVSSFTAVIMLFLAVSPIIYGFFLEKICAKKMLFNASIVLLVTNIFLALSQNYEMFLFFRICEALVTPAILTALMSILANIDKNNIKYNMAIYVAATVFGGLLGRIFSGAIASSFSYEYIFYSLSILLFISLFLIKKLSYEGDANVVKPKLKDIAVILKDKRFTLVYFLMFCMFFVFAGILNILPFRLKELSSEIPEFFISLFYLGYGIGIIVSLLSKRIIKFFKGEINTILFGIVLFLFINLFLFSTNILFIFAILFLFCLGMFTVHSVATGLANSLRADKKSLTSGMYLSFYYLGGASGSYLPAFIYEKYSWDIMMYFFIGILILVLSFVYKLRTTFR